MINLMMVKISSFIDTISCGYRAIIKRSKSNIISNMSKNVINTRDNANVKIKKTIMTNGNYSTKSKCKNKNIEKIRR